MAKPILTISDFQSGLSYDETESLQNGFNDLSNIDIKSILGVAQLSKYFTSGTTNPVRVKSSMVEYSFIPDVTFNGTTQAFYQRESTGTTGDIYYYDTATNNSTLFYTGGVSSPKFAEIKMFNNRLVFSTSVSTLGTIGFWTGGANASIKMNGTTSIRIEPPVSNFAFQPFLKYLEGGTLTFYDAGTWVTRTIVTVTPDANPLNGSTVVINASYTTGNYNGYAFQSNAGDLKRDDGTFLNFSNKNPRNTSFYRPMINFINNLYIGDGDMICQIDNLYANFNTTGKNGSISVGSDYVIKQMEKIGGYMYILTDKINQNYYNNFASFSNKYTKSRLYIWDGISAEFTNFVDIGSHCFSIKAIENRIYAAIQSSNQDGVVFSYFNGSDFPTIAKFQVPFADCPINCIAYDRGRFYVAVNKYDSTGTYQGSTMFAYSSYAIEQASCSKEYDVVTTDTKYLIDGIDYLNNGKNPLLMIYDNKSGLLNSYIRYRSSTSFTGVGKIQSQKYDITPNQFGQLVRGIQVNCKEQMPIGSSITINYRGDEETNFTTLPTAITSANQNSLIWGINRRYRKIQFQLVIVGTDSASPGIVKIMLF